MKNTSLTHCAKLLVGACALFLTACSAPQPAELVSQVPQSQATQESAGQYPVTITNYDYAGREVSYTYNQAPERVVAVYQGSIETMIALGLEDHVIASYGLDNEVKEEWQDGFTRMNYQEDVFAPDKETVTLLQPDMILSMPMRSVSVRLMWPRRQFARAAAALSCANARTISSGMRSVPMGKFSWLRSVWAPQRASCGTSISPMESRSTRQPAGASDVAVFWAISWCLSDGMLGAWG